MPQTPNWHCGDKKTTANVIIGLSHNLATTGPREQGQGQGWGQIRVRPCGGATLAHTNSNKHACFEEGGAGNGDGSMLLTVLRICTTARRHSQSHFQAPSRACPRSVGQPTAASSTRCGQLRKGTRLRMRRKSRAAKLRGSECRGHPRRFHARHVPLKGDWDLISYPLKPSRSSLPSSPPPPPTTPPGPCSVPICPRYACKLGMCAAPCARVAMVFKMCIVSGIGASPWYVNIKPSVLKVSADPVLSVVTSTGTLPPAPAGLTQTTDVWLM